MSDETEKVLADAQEALARAIEEADREKQEFLEGVAGEIAARVDGVAKKIAEEQPDVTKELGRDGVAQLRADLAAGAEKIAAELVGSARRIDWPVPRGRGRSNAHDLASELTAHMDARPLAAIFQAAGFGSGGNYRRTEIHSGHLVGSETPRFERMIDVLRKVEEASRAVAEAKKADDAATVADLWGQ